MNEVLLTAGVAAVFFAVVGGGAKALGFEVPVIESGRRQIALALVGLAFLGAAVLLREDPNPASGAEAAPDPAVESYKDGVQAVCATLPGLSPGGVLLPQFGERTIDKRVFLTAWRNLRDDWHDVFQKLWKREPPDALRSKVTAAHAATDRFLADWGEALDDAEGRLPDPIPADMGITESNKLVNSIAASASDWQFELAQLSGQACSPAQ